MERVRKGRGNVYKAEGRRECAMEVVLVSKPVRAKACLFPGLSGYLSVSPAMPSEATWLGKVTEAKPGVQIGR